VDVPEGDAPAIYVKQRAVLRFKELGEQEFNGLVTRTSGSLDKLTRTLHTQIELDNPGNLNPGMHADVSLTVKSLLLKAVLLPSTAIIIKSEGPKALVLGDQNKVVARSLKLGLDYGGDMQVLSGLTLEDQVVNFPPDGMAEGTKVRPIDSDAEKAQGSEK
jgi:multidrug efflux pump subunit AcrA (membrane-fusion protein)